MTRGPSRYRERYADPSEGDDSSDAGSGRDLDARVEIDLALRPDGHYRTLPRARWMNSVGVHSAKMKLDCSMDSSECDIDSLACGHAPRKVRNRRSPITVRVLIYAHEVTNRFHGLVPFRCACRFTDARVPFGMSSPRPPLTVTRPDLDECLNCRWLTTVVTRTHPSRSSIRITSQTFTAEA